MEVDAFWSIKDILAHLTWCEHNMLSRLRHEERKIPPSEGEDYVTFLERRNAQIFAENRNRSLAEILTEFRTSYEDMLEVVKSLPEADFADEECYDIIAVDTYEHYDEHRESIEAWLAGKST